MGDLCVCLKCAISTEYFHCWRYFFKNVCFSIFGHSRNVQITQRFHFNCCKYDHFQACFSLVTIYNADSICLMSLVNLLYKFGIRLFVTISISLFLIQHHFRRHKILIYVIDFSSYLSIIRTNILMWSDCFLKISKFFCVIEI